MTQASASLARLTLRQLRQKASELAVPLYSRKSKERLINEIAKFQARKESIKPLLGKFSISSMIGAAKESTSLDSSNTRVVFLPRDPQWSYVFWEVSEGDRKKALSQGANRLCLRLADVTDLGDGNYHPHTLQEVPVDSHTTEWYLPIPLSDRDYRVELGYRSSNKWISLAVSSVARVPIQHPSDQILDQFVPFSLEGITESADQLESVTAQVESRDSGLHERLYQSATTHIRQTRIGSEIFQQNSGLGEDGFSGSGGGIWASGLNQSGIGVIPKDRSFWLVADAELVVYGSTDPSASLTIGGEEVPLSSDGTFRLQVPFRDGVQNYPIAATLELLEQTRNITMKFQRSTPEDNTNPSDLAHSEWF